MTDKKTEALKLALEALDVLLTEPIAHKAADEAEYLLLQAAPAIREALADHSTNRPISRLDAYPKEQVAAAKEDVLSAVEHHKLSEQPAQHRKPWVGLTNQELIDLTTIYSGAQLYCAIEAKLREKNDHGIKEKK